MVAELFRLDNLLRASDKQEAVRFQGGIELPVNVVLGLRMGLYNIKSLKGLPDEFLRKYFTKVNDTNYQISSDIKNCVEFKQSRAASQENTARLRSSRPRSRFSANCFFS